MTPGRYRVLGLGLVLAPAVRNAVSPESSTRSRDAHPRYIAAHAGLIPGSLVGVRTNATPPFFFFFFAGSGVGSPPGAGFRAAGALGARFWGEILCRVCNFATPHAM